ncbi:antigen [Merluccius polli]|uniref:Antigen n=1 Tax=Merluccius polli TaxID=89951 RepID=A0AA47MZH1_MERPO|nr:antigen [Merluccius polli]
MERRVNRRQGEKTERRVNGRQGEKTERRVNGRQGEKTERRVSGRQGEKTERRVNGRQGEKTERRVNGRQGEKTERRVNGRQGEKTERRVSGRQGEKTERRVNGRRGEKRERRVSGRQGEKTERRVNGRRGEKTERRVSGRQGEKTERQYTFEESVAADIMEFQFPVACQQKPNLGILSPRHCLGDKPQSQLSCCSGRESEQQETSQYSQTLSLDPTQTHHHLYQHHHHLYQSQHHLHHHHLYQHQHHLYQHHHHTPPHPDDSFSILRMDIMAESDKTKGGGVCLMTNNKWCDPRNISVLSRSCSHNFKHLATLCHPFYLPREFSLSIFHHKRRRPLMTTLHDKINKYNRKFRLLRKSDVGPSNQRLHYRMR